MRDHSPIEINDFNGLWNRGRFEAVPHDHCSDLLNIKFTQDGLDVRGGFQVVNSQTNVSRIWIYKVYGSADRILSLSYAAGTGTITDLTGLGTPILSIAGMTDFAAIEFGGRAYISPSNGSTGLSGVGLYVYTGTGTATLAAGSPTSGTFTVVQSATAGHIEVGVHVFSTVAETATGFLTIPGPTYAVGLDGSHRADITVLPTGPTGTVARWIIATKAIAAYDGNPLGYEFFFVKRIANNTDVTANCDFYDIELVSSADYLFDQFTTIPSMSWLHLYHGRLIGGGEYSNPSVVRLSKPGFPESIDQVTGYITVDPANTSSPVINGQELRDALYLFKRTRTYTTTDNGAEPVNWQLITIDEGIGTDVHGIAAIADSGGVNIDKMFVADRSGLMYFNGVYTRPEMSWKVVDLWKKINQLYFWKVQVAHDPTIQRIYIAAPVTWAILEPATENNTILVADYANYDAASGTFPMSVRWSIWTMTNIKPTTIAVQTSVTDNSLRLLVGSYTDGIYYLLESGTNDAGAAIPTPFAQFGIVPKDPGGTILHAGGLRFKMRGSGTLATTLYDRDKANSYTCPNLTLNTLPGYEQTILTNFKSQGFIIKIGVSAKDSYFQLNGIKLFVKAIYDSFPG